MKKSIYVIGIISIAAALFSCDLGFDKSDGGPQAETAKIRITAGHAGRSILPQVSEDDIAWFELWGAKSGGKEFHINWSEDLLYWGYDEEEYVEIPVGTWNFTLKAIYSPDPDALEGDSILEGAVKNVNITASYGGALNFTLSPVKEGKGAVFIVIELPENSGVSSVVTSIDGEERNPPLIIEDDLIILDIPDIDSGDYLINFDLWNGVEGSGGSISAVITEIVVVRQNLETRRQITLTGNDINSAPRTPLDFYAGISSVSGGTAAVLFTWTRGSGNETGFVISDNTNTYNVSGGSTSYTLPSVLLDGSVSFKIKALNDFGESAWSNSVGVKPGIPANVTVSAATATSITLSWTSVTGATGYYIYRSAAAEGVYTQVGSSATTSYTNTELSADESYYYKVAAYNTGGTGARSASVSAKTLLATPTGVTAAAASTSSITVSWTLVTGAADYYIYRSASAGGTYAQVGTSTSASYTNTGLSSGTTYYYKVAAHNTGGTSAQSAYVFATTTASAPSAPATVTANTASATSISLSWTAVTGATGYYIYRSTSGEGTYTLVGSSTSASYTNTGLTSGAGYFYMVSAYNSGGESYMSSATAFAVAASFGTLTTSLASKTIAADTVQWYRVSVNTSYDWWVQWRDWDINNSYVDIMVDAWSAGGVYLGHWDVDNFDSGANTYGGSIYTGKNEYVYIRVQPYSSSYSGTYYMRYYNYGTL
jgi:fibronectin type 3 domain-containing protein